MYNELIQVEISSCKNTKERRIDKLFAKLAVGDMLIVAELSRVGRNMFETLDVIKQLGRSGVKIIFVRQPELFTVWAHTKLRPAIYSYSSKSERELISLRTKQGLAAALASGKKLGRPKGSRNVECILDPYKQQISEYRHLGLPLSAIRKLINLESEKH